jgi:hypothetical protein
VLVKLKWLSFWCDDIWDQTTDKTDRVTDTLVCDLTNLQTYKFTELLSSGKSSYDSCYFLTE